MEIVRCQKCAGRFGLVETCRDCNGTGVDATWALLHEKDPEAQKAIDAVRDPNAGIRMPEDRQGKPQPRRHERRRQQPQDKLQYITIIKQHQTIATIMTMLGKWGFKNGLIKDLDDETVIQGFRSCLGRMMEDEDKHHAEQNKTVPEGIKPSPREPSDLLKLARLLKRLNDINNDVARSTIN